MDQYYIKKNKIFSMNDLQMVEKNSDHAMKQI
jgi:hypothetical protein